MDRLTQLLTIDKVCHTRPVRLGSLSDVIAACNDGSIICFFYDFQTLLAGVLAIAAAAGTAFAIWNAARLPIRDQRRRETELKGRRLGFTCATLEIDLKIVVSRIRQIEAIIAVVAASNAIVGEDTRRDCYLVRHQIIDDWESISLIPQELYERLIGLSALVHDHNYDIGRVGGAFGDDNFKQALRNRLQRIRTLAVTLSGQLAHCRLGPNSATQRT